MLGSHVHETRMPVLYLRPRDFLATSCAEMDILRPVQWSLLILIAPPNSPDGLVQCGRNSPIVVSRGLISTKRGIERLRNLHAHSVTGRPQTPYHMLKPSNLTSADGVEHFVHQSCSPILRSRTGRKVRNLRPGEMGLRHFANTGDILSWLGRGCLGGLQQQTTFRRVNPI
jgi:hypothetical protein